MPRGVRKTAQQKLPEKVKWATHVPILVIPSAGHSGLMEGTEIATGPAGRQRKSGVERRTPTNSKREHEIPLRYGACCAEHKAEIEAEGIPALISAGQLQGLANRLSQHYGHGALQPRRAQIEWEPVQGQVPCQDCLETAKAAEEAAKRAR